jgi:hypothetical protein
MAVRQDFEVLVLWHRVGSLGQDQGGRSDKFPGMTLLNRVVLISFVGMAAWGQSTPVALTSLKPHKVKVEQTTYKGKKAVRVTDAMEPKAEGNEDRVAVLTNTSFQEGTIEAEVSGEPGPGAFEAARGFVGIAFGVALDVSGFECFYLRPTNGRADDQVRRNHSVQYVSFPEFPWYRLRKEFPEKYETYADLVPGEWTKVRIEVKRERARLFVNGTEQPTLIVNDLKRGAKEAGSIGLWIGPGTVAHFADLRLSR